MVLALVTRTLAQAASKTVQFLLYSAQHALLSAHLEWETRQVNALTVHSPAKSAALVLKLAQNALKKMGLPSFLDQAALWSAQVVTSLILMTSDARLAVLAALSATK